jgi:hypothetical protein
MVACNGTVVPGLSFGLINNYLKHDVVLTITLEYEASYWYDLNVITNQNTQFLTVFYVRACVLPNTVQISHVHNFAF